MRKKRRAPGTVAVALALSVVFNLLSVAGAASVEEKKTQAEVYFVAAATDALTFFEAPSLDFGVRTIALDTRYYPHYNGSGDTRLVVDDIRGSKAGWRVGLELSDFTAGGDLLNGATITFRAPAVNTNALPPPSQTPHLGTSGTISAVTLTAGDGISHVLLTAPTGSGMARTTFAWAGSGFGPAEGDAAAQSGTAIELMAPGGAALAKSYTANLTWTLIDAP